MDCGRESNAPNFSHLGKRYFVSRNELISSVVNKSTQENVNSTKKVLDDYSRPHDKSDTEEVIVDF